MKIYIYIYAFILISALVSFCPLRRMTKLARLVFVGVFHSNRLYLYSHRVHRNQFFPF